MEFFSPGQNPKLVAVSSLHFSKNPNTLSISCSDNFSGGLRAAGIRVHHTSPFHPSDPQLVASVCSSNTCPAGVWCSRHTEVPEKAGPASDPDSLSEGKQCWQVCPPFLTLLKFSSCTYLIILHKNGFDPFKGICLKKFTKKAKKKSIKLLFFPFSDST